MSIQFCVLGSGSSGNATLLMAPDAHVLIDAGFSPLEMAARMDGTGASWESLDAVVLTHTHADHLKPRCLAHCAAHAVTFICHQRHAEELAGTRAIRNLRERSLLRTYDGQPFDVEGVFRFFPISLPHDRPPTFGFRIEARASERQVKIGYIADLGVCEDGLAQHLAGVDLLALEFNHDEYLERGSGRHPLLIQRVLSAEGHLSNRQAAELLRRLLENGPNGGPKVLVQMHLSQHCNRSELAYRAAQDVIRAAGAQTRVFTSRQEQRGTVHQL